MLIKNTVANGQLLPNSLKAVLIIRSKTILIQQSQEELSSNKLKDRIRMSVNKQDLS
jgi:hypothetical protein